MFSLCLGQVPIFKFILISSAKKLKENYSVYFIGEPYLFACCQVISILYIQRPVSTAQNYLAFFIGPCSPTLLQNFKNRAAYLNEKVTLIGIQPYNKFLKKIIFCEC
jgi:hypothetical protein